MKNKTKIAAAIFWTIAAIIFSCNPPASKQAPTTPSLVTSTDSIVSFAEQAYEFGYPIVLMQATKNVSTNFEVPVPGKRLPPLISSGIFDRFLMPVLRK